MYSACPNRAFATATHTTEQRNHTPSSQCGHNLRLYNQRWGQAILLRSELPHVCVWGFGSRPSLFIIVDESHTEKRGCWISTSLYINTFKHSKWETENDWPGKLFFIFGSIGPNLAQMQTHVNAVDFSGIAGCMNQGWIWVFISQFSLECFYSSRVKYMANEQRQSKGSWSMWNYCKAEGYNTPSQLSSSRNKGNNRQLWSAEHTHIPRPFAVNWGDPPNNLHVA